jgi:uncharacterized protein (TIGR02266 family)
LSDNRKFPRTSSKLRCWCEAENVTFFARVGNLSEGGLFLRTSTPLDTGAVARLRLRHGEAHEVEATATVVWSRVEGQESGMGLRFERLDEPSRKHLRRLIDRELTVGAQAGVE